MKDEFKDMIEKYKTELMNYRSNHRQTAPTVKNGTALSARTASSPEGTPSTAPKMPPMPPQNVPNVPIIPGEPLETQPPIEMPQPQPQPQQVPVHRENENNMSGHQHGEMNSAQQGQMQDNRQGQMQSNQQGQTNQSDGFTDRQERVDRQQTDRQFTQQQNPMGAEAQMDTRTQSEARSDMQPQSSQTDLPPIRPNEVEIVPGAPSQPQQFEPQQPPTVITAEEQAQSQQNQMRQGASQGQAETQNQMQQGATQGRAETQNQSESQSNAQSENPNRSDDDEGYFQARVVTAEGAFPVQNALVIVTLVDGQSIVSQMRTNIDGVTRSVSLPAVSRKLSEQPGNVRPFDVYNVEILADGYLPFQSENVPIFGGITNVQNISLIPISEFGSNLVQTAQNTEPNL